jgi:hypothetical protein
MKNENVVKLNPINLIQETGKLKNFFKFSIGSDLLPKFELYGNVDSFNKLEFSVNKDKLITNDRFTKQEPSLSFFQKFLINNKEFIVEKSSISKTFIKNPSFVIRDINTNIVVTTYEKNVNYGLKLSDDLINSNLSNFVENSDIQIIVFDQNNSVTVIPFNGEHIFNFSDNNKFIEVYLFSNRTKAVSDKKYFGLENAELTINNVNFKVPSIIDLSTIVDTSSYYYPATHILDIMVDDLSFKQEGIDYRFKVIQDPASSSLLSIDKNIQYEVNKKTTIPLTVYNYGSVSGKDINTFISIQIFAYNKSSNKLLFSSRKYNFPIYFINPFEDRDLVIGKEIVRVKNDIVF